MNLQRVFAGVVVLLTGSALLVAAALVALTTLLHQVAAEVESSAEGLRAAEAVQRQLLLFDRAADRHLATGEPEMLRAREEAAEGLDRELMRVERFVEHPGEAERVIEARRAVLQYLAWRRELEESGAGLEERYRDRARPLSAAIVALDALAGVNIEQVREAHVRAERWNALADWIGLVTAGLLVLGAAAAIGAFRRLVVRPVLAIAAALRRYAGGEREARLPEEGAAELVEVARRFNEMAASQARQREEQLAFLGGVAHDLKNPLTAMKLSLAVAAVRRELEPERARRTLEVVTRQVDLLERMIGDFLEASRIEAGELELRLEERDAGELLRQVVELHAAGTDHELLVRTPPGPLPLRCDPLRVQQVLNNLVSNATKYSPRRSRVELEALGGPDEVLFRVRDQGVGIAPGELERIFEPFRRVGASARPEVPGVGLGLSTSRRIVLAHGGRIEVESTPGSGSTFTVRLPLRPPGST